MSDQSTNRWCEVLGIDVPRVESVMDHRDANTYARLIVAKKQALADERSRGEEP